MEQQAFDIYFDGDAGIFLLFNSRSLGTSDLRIFLHLSKNLGNRIWVFSMLD